MNKLIIILTTLLIFSSCEDYEDLNVNTKDPREVSGESLFTNGQKNLFDQMVESNVNRNITRLLVQHWTQTTYTDESNYDLVTRTIPDNHWDVMYKDVLMDLYEAKNVIDSTTYSVLEDPAVKTNKLAITDILIVYTYSNLLETFGDVPYSQAINIDEYLLPAYDDALETYQVLITRLTEDINQLDPDNASFDLADNMYQGDVESWIRFGNSLKLRMGLLIADVNTTLAKSVVEEAANPLSGGLISSNAENASLTYLSADPNTNPVFEDLVSSGRHDYVAANTLVDTMNALDDPRRAYFFTQVDTSTVNGVVKLAYLGGPYGVSNNYLSYSNVGENILIPTFEGMILDYSEVEFLLAEAVERGYDVGGTAEEYYNTAIEASIAYWGGTTEEAATYLANPKVAYATAEGTWRQKIGMQSWIALYNRGFEAWTAWRKFDYPVMEAPADAVSDIPVRYTYPIDEQTLNSANYNDAAEAIGGDDVTTKLFFDIQ